MASRRNPLLPKDFQSFVTEEDLVLLHEQYQIPPEFGLEVPGTDDRVCRTPPGRICLYEECFRAGIRLPLHPFFIELLQYYQISPCSLVPNSWRYICGFVALCFLAEIPLSVNLFRLLFALKNHPRNHGWWYISGRKRQGLEALLQGAPTAVHGWKERFLFVSTSSGEDWGLANWREPSAMALREPHMTERLKKELKALYEFAVPSLSELLSEQTLFNVGISRINPLGKGREASEPEARRKRRADAEEGRNVRPKVSDPEVLLLPPPEAPDCPPEDQLPLAQVIPRRARSQGKGGRDGGTISSSSSSGSARIASGSGRGKVILRLPAPPDTQDQKEKEPAEVNPAELTATSGTAPAGLKLEDSALENYNLAHELFSGILLPADAQKLLHTSAQEMRRAAVMNSIRQIHYLNGFMERSRDKAAEASKHKADADMLRSSRDKALREVTGARTKTDAAMLKAEVAEKGLAKAMEENFRLLGKEIAQTAQIEDLKTVQSAHEAEIKKLMASQKERAEHIAALEKEQQIRASRIAELEAIVETRDAEVAQLQTIINTPRLPDQTSQQFEAVISELNGALESAKAEAERMKSDLQIRLQTASTTAIAEFRASPEFEEEKLEFSLEAYEGGLKMVRARVAARHPELDLSFLDEAWDPTAEDAPPPNNAPL